MRQLLSLPALALCVALCGALPACATNDGPGSGEGWSVMDTSSHPALKDGVQLVHWVRGRGPERERRATVRSREVEDPGKGIIDSLGDLLPHCRPIDSGAAAEVYAGLAQLVAADDVPIQGEALTPDPSLDRPGVSGRYGRLDANAWRVPFPPEPRPYGGGWEVSLVILAPPIQNKDLGYWSPWRLLYVRQAVYPDGSLQFLGDKTLTNGDDAARYASF